METILLIVILGLALWGFVFYVRKAFRQGRSCDGCSARTGCQGRSESKGCS